MKCFDKMSSQSMFLRSRFELEFRTLGPTGGVPLSTVPTPMFAIKRSFGSFDVFQNYWKSEIITMISFRLFFSLRAIVLPDLPDVFLVNQCTRETGVQNVQNVQNAENVQNVLKYVYKTYT